MAQPFTIQFGPWAPDLQNVSMQIPSYPAEITPVPCADVLNVYYQDGAYRSIPSPASIGVAAPSQILNAFTWYDNSTGNELVFAGSIDSINELLSGTWSAVPIAGVSPTSFGIRLSQGLATFTNGLFQGTLVIGNSGGVYGFSAGSFGSLTPATDTQGHTITGFSWTTHRTPPQNTTSLVYGTAGLGASYFTQLTIPSLSFTLTSASATYSTGSGISQWVWSGTGPVLSGSYSVGIS